MAISDLCAELRNYFLPSYKNPAKYIHHGTFKVENGQLQNVPFLRDGQYYRIVGSIFNDGVWCVGKEELVDEDEFDGAVWEMAVPSDFIDLVTELDRANAKIDQAATNDTGFTSESFGGYSYTKRAGISDELQDERARIMKKLNSRYRRLTVL